MQTNAYKGLPPRAWLQVQLVSPDGEPLDLELLADTGNPFSVIVPDRTLKEFKHRDGLSAETNFGPLRGGLLCVSVPNLKLIWRRATKTACGRAKSARKPCLFGVQGVEILLCTLRFFAF